MPLCPFVLGELHWIDLLIFFTKKIKVTLGGGSSIVERPTVTRKTWVRFPATTVISTK